MNRGSIAFIYFIIVASGMTFYIPFIGGMHLFDWDEINFAESAREMIISGNYLDVQINFETFWEKPPLFIWMQVLSMKIFGINEFAARFPNAVCGIFSLVVLFRTGRRYLDQKFALLWIVSYTASILPFLYFKSGIIDPWFNLFIFLGLANFTLYLSEHFYRRKYLILSAFFLGLAILTKGPVALLIFLLSFIVYLVIVKFKLKTRISDVILFSAVLIITGGFWFILQILNGNLDVIRDFISYQIRLFSTRDAGHGGFFLYHFVVLLVGVFPASVFALAGYKRDKDSTERINNFHLWMMILFWVVLLLFTIVRTKIVHYSSLCYFPLSFFSAVFLYRSLYKGACISLSLKILGVFIGCIYGILAASLPLIEKFRKNFLESTLIKDPFAKGNLMADVEWNSFITVFGVLFIIAVWIFFSGYNKNSKRSVTGIFASTLLFAYISIIYITPRIEGYSQRAAIEFYKSVSNDDAYITTLGFKSYAHLFYGKTKPATDGSHVTKEQLLKGTTDRPVYIVFKVNRRERYLKEYPDLSVLYEKNGFVFAKRN